MVALKGGVEKDVINVLDDDIFNFIYCLLVTDFSLTYGLVYYMKVLHTEF